jgi:serine protease Do
MAMVYDTKLADDLAVTAERVRRSTVHVRNGQQGGGAGVIWRPEGLIITNAHVARGTTAEVELFDGRTFEAQVTSRDPQRDLASLTIGAEGLPAAPIADSDTLRVGQVAVAVGNPLGLSGALTLGIIHAIAPAEGRGRQTWVQADIRLAPGNSGGPLVDASGAVIGINSMIAGGLGLAVPSNAVINFLMVQGERPRLGLTMQPVLVPVGTRRDAYRGLLVLEVAPDSAADRAGVYVGDILIGVGGRHFSGPRDLDAALRSVDPTGTMFLDLLRGGKLQSFPVVLSPDKQRSSTLEGAGAAA